jgi:hypothetical protein
MLALVVYIPESHLDVVKNALFAAGAGKIGDYDHCCFQSEGMGQFRPLAKAQPHLGKVGELEKVKEWRVEMVLENSLRSAVETALKESHPYETPAYWVLDLLNSS